MNYVVARRRAAQLRQLLTRRAPQATAGQPQRTGADTNLRAGQFDEPRIFRPWLTFGRI
jgi:hypothetical protein